jgi:hypothetical protein
MPFDCAAEAAAGMAKGVRPPLPITTTTVAAVLRSSRTLSPHCAPPPPSAEPWWLRTLRRDGCLPLLPQWALRLPPWP